MKIQSYHEPGDAVLAAWQEQVEQAQEKPWLASLLLRQGQRILRHFAYFYERLRALPRNTRRTIQKKLATTLAGAALLLALAGPVVPAAHAATITVNPGSTGVNGSDGGCSLVEAILTANTGSYSSGDCDGGTAGADTITLAGNTYSYTTAYGSSAALPDIQSAITIEANGATIQRTGGAEFRIMTVTSATGDLTLNEATISGGNVPALYGGGIANYGGSITVNRSTITANTGYYGGGLESSSGGTITINNSTISGNQATGGGGLATANTVVINNSTFTGNQAAGVGGGILSAGSVTLNRSIVSGNAAPNGREVYNSSYTFADNYNLFGYNNDAGVYGLTPGPTDVVPGAGVMVADILNATLSNQGGGTSIHHLVVGSPAIDAAPSAACTAVPINNVDQRGLARNIDGLGDGDAGPGLECDIGAHEMQSPTAVTLAGLTANGDGKAAPAALGAAGVLALLSGGWLARVRRRKA